MASLFTGIMHMRHILKRNEDLTEAIFWVCLSSIAGSLLWIILHT